MTMALSRSTPAVRKPSSNVRVVARVRPLLPDEVKCDPCPILTCLANKPLHDPSEPEILQVDNGQRRWFELDAVLDDQCTQEDVYTKSGTFRAVTEDIFKGYNCTILAYGRSKCFPSCPSHSGSSTHGRISDSFAFLRSIRRR